MEIARIDPNLAIKSNIDQQDLVWYDCREAPFSLHGLLWEDGFCRMPGKRAEQVSQNVSILSRNTAGGRVRFRTDSPYVAISCTMPSIIRFPHMALLGTTGFDLYVDGMFADTFRMPVDLTEGYEAIVYLPGSGMRDILIHFPLYNDVSSLHIGLAEQASIQQAAPYRVADPVVFYGSSITQGVAVSRPGNSYISLLSGMLDFDYVNLGFGGNAKGEQAMADYIAGLHQSVFVMDYDHNTPSVQHLEQTHPRFFDTIRSKQPHLPVVMISRPDFRYGGEQAVLRREVIRSTYQKAREAGDQNVWFIDGETLWGSEGWDSCTIDTCHPNDLGQWRMAVEIAKTLGTIPALA